MSITKEKVTMKIYSLVIVFLLTLAGCSTSYKGSIKADNGSPDLNAGKCIVSHSATNR